MRLDIKSVMTVLCASRPFGRPSMFILVNSLDYSSRELKSESHPSRSCFLPGTSICLSANCNNLFAN